MNLQSQVRFSTKAFRSVSYDIVYPQDSEHTKLRVLDRGYAEQETDNRLIRTVIRV